MTSAVSNRDLLSFVGYLAWLSSFILFILQQTPAMRCLALSMGLALTLCFFWTRDWSLAVKINSTAALAPFYLVTASSILFPPPTYIYLIVSRSLGENNANALTEMIPRRAFVVEQKGSGILHNVSITVRDNRGTDQMHNDHVESYPEIDPTTLFSVVEPLHFWLRPAKPWNEDYTIAISSLEIALKERVRVGCIGKDILFAIRVVPAGKDRPLFTCKDDGLRGDLSEWKDDYSRQCQSIIPLDGPKFEATLTPRPFVLVYPQRIIDMTPNIYADAGKHLIADVPACPEPEVEP